jgi:hypothetical protein
MNLINVLNRLSALADNETALAGRNWDKVFVLGTVILTAATAGSTPMTGTAFATEPATTTSSSTTPHEASTRSSSSAASATSSESHVSVLKEKILFTIIGLLATKS